MHKLEKASKRKRIGSIANVVFFFRPPLDERWKNHMNCCFGWLHVSRGHLYANSFDYNLREPFNLDFALGALVSDFHLHHHLLKDAPPPEKDGEFNINGVIDGSQVFRMQFFSQNIFELKEKIMPEIARLSSQVEEPKKCTI